MLFGGQEHAVPTYFTSPRSGYLRNLYASVLTEIPLTARTSGSVRFTILIGRGCTPTVERTPVTCTVALVAPKDRDVRVVCCSSAECVRVRRGDQVALFAEVFPAAFTTPNSVAVAATGSGGRAEDENTDVTQEERGQVDEVERRQGQAPVVTNMFIDLRAGIEFV
jgi:hypothetical protein